MPPRVFLDTNVWFSAIYGSDNCEAILRAAKHKSLIPVISGDVLDELIVNLKKKIPEAANSMQEIILNAVPELVSSPKMIPPSVKRAVVDEDQKIIAAAIASNADYFITGNIKDFKRNAHKKVGKVTVLTPKEAVKTLKLTRD